MAWIGGQSGQCNAMHLGMSEPRPAKRETLTAPSWCLMMNCGGFERQKVGSRQMTPEVVNFLAS